MAKGQTSDIQSLDAQLAKIQKGTRTLVPAFLPLHDVLRNRYSWYYNWSSWEFSKAIHKGVLLLYILAVGGILTGALLGGQTKVLAATATLYPDGDSTPLQWTPTGGGSHYTQVADSNDGTNVSTAEFFYQDTYNFQTTTASSVTQIDAHVRCTTWGGTYVGTRIYMGGAWSSYQNAACGTGGSYLDNTLTWTGSWTQTDLSNLQVRIENIDPAVFDITVSQVYVVATYTSAAAPTVVTNTPTSITTTGMTFNGNVTSDGGSAITARGFKWSAGATCTDANTQAVAGTTGAYSVAMSPAGSVNTQYSNRAYATNAIGTSYGSCISKYTLANTPSAPTVDTPTTSSLNVTINVNSNPAITTFAFGIDQDSNSAIDTNGWVQAGGTLGASAVYQTKAIWGATGKVVTGLASGTTYNFRVFARNGDLTVTAISAIGSGTTTITVPTAPSAAYTSPAASTTSITVNWTDASSNETGFKIWQDNGCTGAFPAEGSPTYTGVTANETSHAMGSLTANTSYCFKVKSYNAGGNSATYTNVARGQTLATKLEPSTALGPSSGGGSQTFRLRPSTTKLTADNAAGSSAATFTRADQNATYVTDSGNINTVESSGDARIERVTTSDISQNPGTAVRIEEARTNRLLNSSLENWTGGVPDNWVAWNNTVTQITASANVLHGTSSARITSVGSGRGEKGNSGSPIAAGTYTFSAWVKSVDGSSVGIYAFNNDYSVLLGQAYSTSTSWARVSFTFTLASEIAYIIPILGHYGGTFDGYFDAAQLEAGAFATSYIPTTTAAVTRAGENVQYANTSNLTTGAGTVSMWVKPEWASTDTNNWRGSDHYGGLFDSGYYSIGTNALLLSFWTANNTANNYLCIWQYGNGSGCGAPAFTANSWHFVQLTYQTGTQPKIYWDGSLLATSSNNSNNVPVSGNFMVGKTGWANPNSYFNGLISDFTIFNTALSAPQVTAVYGGYAPTIGTQTPTATTTMDVNYTDNSGNETGFYIDRGGAGQTTCSSATYAGGYSDTATPYPDTGLAANTAYCYRVRGYITGGATSLNSNTASAKYTLIEAISGITFSNIQTTSVTIAPTNTPSNLTSGSSGIQLKNTTNNTCQDGAACTAFQQSTAAWQSSGLSVNTVYGFSIQSRNSDGVTTTASTGNKYTLANQPSPPNLYSTATDSLHTIINANSNPAGTNYKIFYDTSPTGAFASVCQDWTAHSNQDDVTCGSLTNNTAYYMKVRARNGDTTETADASLRYAAPRATKLTPNSTLQGYIDTNGMRLQSANSDLRGDSSETATFTRADANATFMDDNGKLVTVLNSGDPRTEKVSTTDIAQAPGRAVRIEEARTNSFLQSSFEAGTSPPTSWGVGNGMTATVTAGGNHGSNYASLVTGASSAYSYMNQNIALTAGTTYTFSVYAKWVSGTNGNFYLLAAQGAEAYLTSATTISSSSWQRVTLTFTATVSTTYAFYVEPSRGVANNVTVMIDSAQLEVGAFATSYIPTTTGAVTRAAESVRYSKTNNWNTSEMTLSAWVKTPPGWTSPQMIMDAGIGSHYTMWRVYNGNEIRFYPDYNTTLGYVASSTLAWGTNEWHHVAVTVNQSTSTIRIYLDGIDVTSGSGSLSFASIGDTNGYIWPGSSTGATYQWNNLLSDFTIFNTALDADTVRGVYNGYGPSNVAISDPTVDGQLTTTWQDNSGNEDAAAGFTVEYKQTATCTETSGWGGTTTKAQNTTSHDQGSLTNELPYCFHVRGNVSTFNSPYSYSASPGYPAGAYTWTGNGGDNNWSTTANWLGNSPPGVGNTARFTDLGTANSRKNGSVDAGFGAASVGALTLASGYTGTVTMTKDVTVTGDVAIANGILNTASQALNVGGSWNSTGGAISSTGLVNFNAGTTGKTITADGEHFYNLTFNNAAGGWTFSDAQNVDNDFTITAANTSVLGAFTHNFSGNVTLGGTTLTTTGSTVVMNGTTKNLIGAGKTLNNLTISGTVTETTSDVSINGTLTIDNTKSLTIDSGRTVTMNGSTATVAGTLTSNGTFSPASTTTVGGAGTLNGSGTAKVTKTGTDAFSSQYTLTTKTLTNLTVQYAGAAAQTVSAITYGHLEINMAGQTATLGDTTTVGGNLTITAGTLAGSTYTLNLAGNWSNSGIFTANTSTVNFNAGATGKTLAGTMTGGSSFNNVIFNNASGGWSVSNAMAVGGNFTLTLSEVAVNGVNLNNQTTTITGDLAINGGKLTSGSAAISVGNNFSNAGTFVANTSTLTMNAGASGKTLAGTMTGTSAFNNLTFNNAAGGWTLSNDIKVTTVLNINTGTLNASNKTIELSGAGTPFVKTGTFNKDTSTVKYTAPADTNITAANYYHLELVDPPAGEAGLPVVKSGGILSPAAQKAVEIAILIGLLAEIFLIFRIVRKKIVRKRLPTPEKKVKWSSWNFSKAIHKGILVLYILAIGGLLASTLLGAPNKALAATATLYPDGDSTPLQWTPTPGGTHYTAIDEASPNDADYVSTQIIGYQDTFNFQTTTASSVTQIDVHVRCASENEAIRVYIYMGGAWQSYQDPFCGLPPGYFDSTLTWTGSWTQTDLNNLQVRIEALSPGALDDDAVSQLYVVATYTVTVAPTVTTNAASSITSNSAYGNGTVTNNGGANATSAGYYLYDGAACGGGTLQTPNQTGLNLGTGSPIPAMQFTSLTARHAYSFKAWATNTGGTGWGSCAQFTTSAPTYTLAAGAFDIDGHLTIGNGTDIMTVTVATNNPTIDLEGDMSITANSTFIASNSASFTVAGSWSNSGAFTAGTGTVTLDGAGGSTQTLSGNTTFKNLSATATAARTIKFTDGSTTTVTGTWTVTGASYPDNLITLTRTSTSSAWTINPTAANISYANVSWSNSGLAICAAYSTNGGNNTNWQITYGAACITPGTPTGFGGVAISNERIDWTWTDNADNEDNIQVQDESNTNKSGNLTKNTLTWSETSLGVNTCHTRHTYFVNDFGNTVSTPDITVCTLANDPGGPTLSANSWDAANGNSLAVTIAAAGNPTNTEFAIACDATPADWLQNDGSCAATKVWKTKSTWEGGTTNYLKSLPADTNYTLVTLARNGDNIDTNNSPASGSTMTAPAQPTGLSHTGNTTTSITWDLNNNAVAPTGYHLLNNTDQQIEISATSDFIQDQSDPGGTPLAINTQYTVKTRGYRGAVTGQPTGTSAAYTSIEDPTGITATADSISQISLAATGTLSNLNAGSSGLQFGEIQGNPGAGGQACFTGWTQTNSCADTGLTANTMYRYTATARNGDGEPSSTYSFQQRYTHIETPTTIASGLITPNSIAITMSDALTNLAVGSSGIQFAETSGNQNGGQEAAFTTWPQTTSTTDTGLKGSTGAENPEVGTTYIYKVQARNAEGVETTSYSPDFEFTTTAGTQLLFQMPGETLDESGTNLLSYSDPTPNQVTAGVGFNLTIYAADPANYRDLAHADTITLSSTDSQATFPAAAAMTSGNITYNNVIMKTVGNQTISGLGSAGSSHEFAVVASTASATNSTAVASPTSLNIGNTSTVTIILKDGFGNKLAGHTVSVSSDQAGDSISFNRANTDSNGRILAYVTSNTPHTSTLTVRDTTDGVTLSSHPQITFTAPAIDNPGNFAVNAGDAQVALSWTNPGGATFKQVNIYRSTTSGALGSKIASTSSTSHTDLGLENGVTYFYTLKSEDNFGSESSGTSQLAATPQSAAPPADTEAPTAPSNLRATDFTATTVDLAWDASTDNVGVTGYELYNADTNVLIGTTTERALSLTDLTPGTTYRFKVRAYDGAGNFSGFSDALTITTRQPVTEEEKKIAEEGGIVAYLVLGGVPAEVNAGQNFPDKVRVTVADAGGRIVDTYNKAIYFSSTDNDAKLSFDKNHPYTFTDVDAGIHEFAGKDFVLNTAGKQKLVVSDYSVEAVAEVNVLAASILPGVFQKASDKVQDFFSEPENIAKVNTGVVTTTAAILLTPVAINTALALSTLWPQIIYWLTQLMQVLGIRKRRKPWGVVFNSQTGQPIPLAIVRIYDKQYNRILEQSVTDNQGRYGFLTKPGTFYIVVSKSGFSFPSVNKISSFYEKVYNGGDFKIAGAQAVAFNIPLDPHTKPGLGINLWIWLVKVNRFLQKLRLPLLVLGIIFAVIMIIIQFELIFVLSLIFYLLIGVLEYLRTRKARPYGIVTDTFNHPLELTIVRIYDKRTGRLMETDVTDRDGRYKFLVSPGIYYLTAIKPGYIDFKSHLMYLQKEQTLVSTNIKMKKEEK